MQLTTRTQSVQLFELVLSNRIIYFIKVVESLNIIGTKKLYFKDKKLKKTWTLFATCDNIESMECTIRVHFGSRGKLVQIN